MALKYFMFDVETSGPTPGKYSILSLGACVVGESDKNFYRELKPISRNFIPAAMKVGSKGLQSLKAYRHLTIYNPESEKFQPELVLNILRGAGEEPRTVMKELAEWVIQHAGESKPYFIAAPIVFDGMFIYWYFDNFLNRNPFSHSGDDLTSIYKGVVGNLHASVKHLKLRQDGNLTHNALEDAIQQAREFEEVIRLMKE